MRFSFLSLAAGVALGGVVPKQDVSGHYELVKRQLPKLANKFEFELDTSLSHGDGTHDAFEVTQNPHSKKIKVTSATKSGLSAGLYRYLTEEGHVSIALTGSTLGDLGKLPDLCSSSGCRKISGEAVVELRHSANTVTHGYTYAFDMWDDWQKTIDWLALMGVNLPLQWNGYEQLLYDTLLEFDFTKEGILDFISGPAFLPWNRFGNIQGQWNVTTGPEYLQQQLDLQKKIVSRMSDLGIQPVLPVFTGFVPREISKIYPDANTYNASDWNGFGEANSRDTFLNPTDELFAKIQKVYMEKQKAALGDVSHYYALDIFNELSPPSNASDYLKNMSSLCYSSIRANDDQAVQVVQGWFLENQPDFWTKETAQAFFSGFKHGELLVLDLYAEGHPQYQRVEDDQGRGYFGHDWVWCQLHDFGGSVNFEGSFQILTQNFTEARKSQPNLIGIGNTPEGYEGNDIDYTLMFQQAWSSEAIDIDDYTESYIKARYGPNDVPSQLIDLWKKLVELVYTNDQSTGLTEVPKSIFEHIPNVKYTADDPNFVIYYDNDKFTEIFKEFAGFALKNPDWLKQPQFFHDLVDVTRQALSNSFQEDWTDYTLQYRNGTSPKDLSDLGKKMVGTLELLDSVLSVDPFYDLGTWINKAKRWGDDPSWEFNARNQLTLWGPVGQIDFYASKQWHGVVDYYKTIWSEFFKFVEEGNDSTKFQQYIRPFQEKWCHETWEQPLSMQNLDSLLKESLSRF